MSVLGIPQALAWFKQKGRGLRGSIRCAGQTARAWEGPRAFDSDVSELGGQRHSEETSPCWAVRDFLQWERPGS